MPKKAIPVILHTDLATDIDDSWAILMMLRQRQLKPLMILTDTGDVAYRAAVVARMLETAGRTEIEIGLGCDSELSPGFKTLEKWMKGYKMANYSGKVYEDGCARAIELIRASKEPVTLVSIAPCPALAKMLKAAPDITEKVNFIGMFGSVYKKYGGVPGRCGEYNVRIDIPAAKKVLEAPWRSIMLTPLDTCGLVQLDKKLYAEMMASKDKDVKLLMDSVEAWKKNYPGKYDGISSVLFDTVAIHMASSLKYLQMNELRILVDKQGRTCPNKRYGKPMQVAVNWTDLPAYNRFLVDTLLGK